MHPSGGSHAKIVALPGANIVGAGADAQFRMNVPIAFTGTRLVLAANDPATLVSSFVFVLSIQHDNVELIANGRLGPITNTIFGPPVMLIADPALGFAAMSSPGLYVHWHEYFRKGDVFSITVRNPTGNPLRIECYWVTDYGTTCGNKKRGNGECA